MASAAKLRILPFGYAVFRRPTTVLVNFCCRYWSTCPTLNAGKKIRVSRGQAGDGIAYGALTDLPDWSYADGTPAPETKRRKIRRFRRLDVANQIKTYLQEVEKAAQKRDRDGNLLESKPSK
ncbi:39S ribosomal protein L52, mitochondrial-like [Acropora millepora]|uniref:39S ribosomal protein L52, mitochondrial-like n=1 Tax=Acropora millepora TaxID=45264 RepID=UPI0010FCCAA8|nr:39S ribosomal protein L52, mitochondrial-like [Acropora millepora]